MWNTKKRNIGNYGIHEAIQPTLQENRQLTCTSSQKASKNIRSNELCIHEKAVMQEIPIMVIHKDVMNQLHVQKYVFNHIIQRLGGDIFQI